MLVRLSFNNMTLERLAYFSAILVVDEPAT